MTYLLSEKIALFFHYKMHKSTGQKNRKKKHLKHQYINIPIIAVIVSLAIIIVYRKFYTNCFPINYMHFLESQVFNINFNTCMVFYQIDLQNL